MSGRSGASRLTLFRVRAALWLTTLVALLSVVTGIANIGTTTVRGPLREVVPQGLGAAAGFTGALTGFLMLAAVYGLKRQVRAGWYLTVLLLPLTALQGVAQLGRSTISVPLIALSLVALPVVLVNYRVFDRALDLSTTQLAALAAIVGVQAYGTVGTYVLREQFQAEVRTVTDAFYFTLVTASTVGYGDLTPVTQTARLFVMSVVVLGTASFAVALGTLLTPAIEARLAQALGTMDDTQLDIMEDHVIVVGVSDLTEPIIETLADGNVDFAVITQSPERAAELRSRGIEVLTADPSDEEPLERAGIARARALVAATNDDARDALAILTARELNRNLTIVAAATERENVRKLKRAGADTVLSPAVIGGNLLVQSALGNEDAEGIAERIMDSSSHEPFE